MNPKSPHFQFEPESIGWLHRKVHNRDFITAADLARIGKADAAAFSDSVFQEQTLLALEKRLPARSGRPPEDPVKFWLIAGAADMVKERTAEIVAERKEQEGVPDFEPRVQAANEIAALLQLHISGLSLLNRISALKADGLI